MVTVVSACDLPRAQGSANCNPQCVLTLGAQTVMSKKVSHSLNPIWRETLMLSWDKLDALVIKVLHTGRFRKQGKEEVLCSVKVDLKEVVLGGGTGDGDGGMVMETVAGVRAAAQEVTADEPEGDGAAQILPPR
jgi:hypothetical protein